MLATEVFENTLARLTGRHKTKPTDAEVGLFFTLAESLRRERAGFIKALQQCLRVELPAALKETPGELRQTKLSPFDMPDNLGLIDEAQALEDVAISGVINAIQETSAIELAQLGRMFDALRGSRHSRRDINPLRPSVFARLLCHALHELPLAPAARAALLRVAGQALAEALAPVYMRLCEHTQDTDMQPLLALMQSEPDPYPEHVFSPNADALNDELPTVPHTLDNLIRRMQEHDAQHKVDAPPLAPDELPSLDGLIASFGMPHEIGDAPPARTVSGPTPFPSLASDMADSSEAVPSASTIELLSRVYDKVLDDPGLLPEVRKLLSRLQASVLRVAEQDGQLLSNQEHPIWQFINCMASHSAGFSQTDNGRLRAFLTFVESLVARISMTPSPTATLYWEALYEAQQYIDIAAHQAAAKTQVTIEALERGQQREKWRSILRQQVHEQLKQAVVSTTVRAFLEGPWVKAMAETMVRFGPEADEVPPMVELVDDLLWSVQPLRRPEEREQLRQMLPTLTARLQFGFDLIQWPEAQRSALLDELMDRHTRLLRSAPAPHSPLSEMGTMPEQDTTPSVHGAMDTLGQADSNFWNESQVDRGVLPTVPVPLGAPDDDDLPNSLDAWLVGLRLGSWCHLFAQSRWTTAQLTWISDSRNYFVFSGAQGDAPLSLTRGALLQLRAAGLLTALEERPVVQRAVDNMMHTLDH